MYYTNKTTYYVTIWNELYEIGSKKDLIYLLAKSTYVDPFDKKLKNKYYGDLNLSGTDVIKSIDYITNEEYFSYRRFRFYESYCNELIPYNIFDIYNEVMQKYYELKKRNIYTSYWYTPSNKKSKKQGRKYHNGWHFKHKSSHHKRTLVLASDPEYKKYTKPRSNGKNIPTPWDDPVRKVQGSWKYQTKSKKQYGKNIKDTKSIKNMFYEEEEFDVDFLLEMDFLRKLND
jgi:hypothetical protein